MPTISLPTSFSTRSIPRLQNHLQALADLADVAEWPGDPEEGETWPEMAAEVQRLQEAPGDWRDSFQESLDEEENRDSPSQRRIDALHDRIDQLDRYADALDQQDLPTALDVLQEIEPLEEGG